MRRVVFVVAGAIYGGPANVLATLHDALRERGWEALGVFPDDPGNAVTRLRERGITAYGVPMHRARATSSPGPHAALLWHAPREIQNLRRLFRAERVDLVQHHGDLNPHGAIAARAERLPLAWQIIDTRTPPRLRRLTAPVIRRSADAVMTWGTALGRAYPGVAELGARHVTVYPPVDHERLRPTGPEARARARAALGVPPDAVLVGAVGNRNPQKGHAALVRAVATARRDVPDLALRILGAPSPGHEQYDEHVAATARTLGLEGDAFAVLDAGGRVPELLPAFDVLVVSSEARSEGVPTVLAEAMAFALPVVSTDVGAVRELLDDGVEGLVVPPGEDDALAAAIVALREPDVRTAMGAAGRARIEREHGLDRCADRYVHGWEVALAHHAGRGRRR